MFGWKLVSKTEKLLEDALWSEIVSGHKRTIETLEHRIGQLENEIEYYRKRADDERARADRQLDAILQQNGLPEVTETSRTDTSERDRLAQDRHDKQQQQLNELFAETMNTLHDDEGLELPPELQDAAAGMIPEKE